jgi:hypothetical protein
MQNGRPADGSYWTAFHGKESTKHVDSLEEKIEISGWQEGSIKLENYRNAIGYAKRWEYDGSIYIGKFEG